MNKSWLALTVSLAFAQPALANIDIQFDYGYDTSGFFTNNANRMSVLESAASILESRFSDNLTAITSSGANSFNPIFFNPSSPSTTLTLDNASFGANVIRVYVGAADLGSNTLGVGGPGGFSCSGIGSFCENADQRGQGPTQNTATVQAVDVAPWGGAISFDSGNTNWHFGTTTAGLTSGQFDFYSVAVHELGHILGFGTSDSFSNLVVGSSFVGATAGTVPLDADRAHWAAGTLSIFNGASQETAMDPTLTDGVRKNFTDLDFAAMNDIGWAVTPVPEADTWAMLLAGLGLVGFMSYRRRPA